MVAKVILNSNSMSTDRLYDYNVPSNLEKILQVGMRVVVPFGRGNKTMEAYVFDICSESDFSSLKSISEIINETSYFSKKDTEIITFMRHRYFCSYISAIRCFVPSGVSLKISSYISIANDISYEEIKKYCKKSMTADKIISCLHAYGTMSEDSLKQEISSNNINSVLKKLESKGYITISSKKFKGVTDTLKTYVELLIDRDEAYSLVESIHKKAPARARVIEILCENFEVELAELLVYAQTGKATVDSLVSRGIAAYRSVICNDSMLSYDESYSKTKPVLTQTQQYVVQKITYGISSPEKYTCLIHGVTGSGKTEVYLSLIENTISQGKDAILLVPEISLTPQMISQIFGRFGDNVAVLHSRLTVKQRYVEWTKIKNGEVKIAVGARSAVFAPFKNLGLIIIDEEHESTYKSEMSPRYDTIEIARYIVGRDKSALVLASATPSIADYYKTTTETFDLVEMPERINKSELPSVDIVDMRKEMESGNLSIFSSKLIESMHKSLFKKEQIILFLNRRGFSGFVSCRNCGYVVKCPRCNVSLTYHRTSNSMVCHYCDYKTSLSKVCPSCESKHIRFFGIGTEKVVDEINKIFPESRVLRMDADTTSGRMGHENILNHFRSGNADILVGTQMITKGLDFDNVTLVGIVAADMSLNSDDYKASERTFDLITQVIGRAGRGHKKGTAIIQTYNPDDETIILSASQDYKSFYKEEINIRKLLMYPPFAEFIKVQFSSSNQEKALEAANEFYTRLLEYKNEINVFNQIFSVSESPVFKINEKYRYRFMIKTVYNKEYYDYLHEIYNICSKNYCDVNILIDVNPISTY